MSNSIRSPKQTSRLTQQVFLNIVLDEAVEDKDNGEKVRLGMVVRIPGTPRIVEIVAHHLLGHPR